MSTPKGEAHYRQMVQASYEKGDPRSAPKRTDPMYLFRSKGDNKIKEYDNFAQDFWVYEESFEPQEWEIIPDSTKTILGYECIKAVCDYHGRQWTAWFAPEIPVSDGPWKLCGLPGLILGAEEAEGKYSFLADGIRQESREIYPNFAHEKYQKTERKKYLKLKRKFSKNPLGYAGQTISNLPPIQYDETYDLIEKDYDK
ncbi:MAG: GLPGLI family protein [Muribaculaceae bacterium]|nr:GLPGLI family protein [Muribaculaceae bacterium]